MQEPMWLEIKPVKNADSSLGPVLSDIESHMPDPNQYRDPRKVTWAHETTHGINSIIRNMKPGTNGFYVLKNRGFSVVEPTNYKLSDVAAAIPTPIRGMSYKLYLKDQQRYWQDNPTYPCDEWSAYTNGLNTALSFTGGDGVFSDTLQMMEFMGYGLVLATMINNEQFRLFVYWQAARNISLANEAKKMPNLWSGDIDKLIQTWRGSDLNSIKDQLKKIYGKEDFIKVLFDGERVIDWNDW